MTVRRPPSSMRAVLARRAGYAVPRPVVPVPTQHGRRYSTPLAAALRVALAERQQWWIEERAWWEREGLAGPADLRGST